MWIPGIDESFASYDGIRSFCIEYDGKNILYSSFAGYYSLSGDMRHEEIAAIMDSNRQNKKKSFSVINN